ncbi:MAG: GNAT family N-acetyltransferase [Bacilli bacterium]|nr:GNAT family N-acetyltransferase [Bacilli bacterium]
MVEQGFKEEFDEDDKTCWCLVLFVNGVPVSTGRLKEIDPETYQVQRLAVRKPFRGKRIGEYTLKFLITKARTLGARSVVLESQYDKVGFYRKMRFKFLSEDVVFDQGYPHLKMYKIIVSKNKPKTINF